MEWKRLHRLLRFTISVYALFTTVTSAAIATACPESDSSNCAALTAEGETFFQELGKESDNYLVWKMNGRRYLSGPGSFPPRCTSKCGRCTPCKPVHVPVPPGTPVTAEYYPEAWRCKCGNKLYIP